MKILKVSQIQRAEENAVKNGIFSYEQLMYNAGNAAAKIINERYKVSGKRVCIICGNGNNGGDGLVIANILNKFGADVSLVFPIGFPKTKTALAYKNFVSDLRVLEGVEDNFDIIVDALFGIGLNRFLSEEIANLLDKINRYSSVKIAIDVPSGVFADGGEVHNAFNADLTISFSCYKLCQLLPKTSSFCGETIVVDIGLPLNEYSYMTIEPPSIKKRNKNSHKGTYGTAVMFCGAYGMCGAQILAAKAALRCGVGILKAIVCDKNYSAFTSAVPEAVTIPVETTKSGTLYLYERQLLSALLSSTAALVGCGLGRNNDTKKLVTNILQTTTIPTVIDADGINALVGSIELINKMKAPSIITPHPAEMARLFNITVDEVENNRVNIARKFAANNNCILVLKGTNTIVAAPDGRLFFNTTGNSGLATGGSGDVLSGMIVSLLAQGENPLDAALSAVWLHGKAADNAATKYTERSLLPSDIIEELKYMVF